MPERPGNHSSAEETVYNPAPQVPDTDALRERFHILIQSLSTTDTVRSFEEGSELLEAVIDRVEEEIGKVDLLRPGYWHEFFIVVEKELRAIGVRGGIVESPLGDWEVQTPPGLRNIPGIRDTNYQHHVRLLVRDFFNNIVEQGLLSKEDKEEFLQAMPCVDLSASSVDSWLEERTQSYTSRFEGLMKRDNAPQILQAMRERYALHRRLFLLATGRECLLREGELTNEQRRKLEKVVETIAPGPTPVSFNPFCSFVDDYPKAMRAFEFLRMSS